VVLVMADDSDYVEGDSNSAPADAPGAVPSDDAPAAPAADVIDSASVQDAPVQRMNRSTARTAGARKAFADAILANKAKPAAVNEDQEDPEDVALAAAEVKPAAATAPPAAPPPAPPAPEPPAPSLHPEVLKLKQQLEAERAALQAERAAAAPPAPAPLPDASSLEDYIDNSPRAYRNWLESMRGEKFTTDDEFKAEVSDFITQMSADVLGVPLPENVRIKLDAAQARKAVRTHKTILAKKEAALAAKMEADRTEATTKAEADRVEAEWSKAATVLSQQFQAQPGADGKPATSQAAAAYPWLAAEDDPGKIVVDVIRAAMTKDGTQLAWQEASKKANDYLAEQAKRYYDKRKPLLATAAAPAAPKPAVPAAKPAPLPEARVVPPKKWSRDNHMENTKAAFRQMLTAKPE
jgi:hypothetical protein